LAQDPLSLVTMALAGSKGDISQTTRCGLTGLASAIARPSSFFHHAATLASMVFDHSRSSLRLIRGSSAFSVAAASPCRLTSAGYRSDSIEASMSI
jgi:hypothetical protein